ncbi:SHOCT domain-containing protein [Gryllotalpicola protaetiae]|uniref:SHOCT domain-containing protein n=1 Tax=Gryllotalpicola protaetiae TaxID=2419771 RepID=A0A387BEC9_9MICO|nr:SHOCT domain-containing protein [Gryllotalpicola protaetiae]AYG02325.1 SHOCT domain-containing protein [Gryllotalpicola protaetiae]
MTFFQSIWLVFEIFLFIAYLMILFQIIGDLFRDKSLNGWVKAIWILFLVIVPLITAIVYVIARGRGMGQRQLEAQQRARHAADDYIRSVAGSGPEGGSPVEQIARAKDLLDAGAITQAEFDKLKADALR